MTHSTHFCQCIILFLTNDGKNVQAIFVFSLLDFPIPKKLCLYVTERDHFWTAMIYLTMCFISDWYYPSGYQSHGTFHHSTTMLPVDDLKKKAGLQEENNSTEMSTTVTKFQTLNMKIIFIFLTGVHPHGFKIGKVLHNSSFSATGVCCNGTGKWPFKLA